MKAHIGTATFRFCGAVNRVTSDITVTSARFVEMSPSIRCKRCEKKLAAQTAKAMKRMEVRE